MDLGLTDRVAFVAASTGGLGRAIATALAHEGAKVVVTGRRQDAAQELAESLPSAIGLQMDVTDAASRAAAVADAERQFGPIDILVANGPGPSPSAAAGVSAPDIEAAFQSLVAPACGLISLVLPRMRECRWGRILAVGSSGIVAPLPGLATSNLGRAALAGYLKTLAGEVARDGVTVNIVLPGRIDTERVRALDDARARREGCAVEDVQRRSIGTIPIGRYGRPDEFGSAAAFLCSEQASYITGVAMRCDGGLIGTL